MNRLVALLCVLGLLMPHFSSGVVLLTQQQALRQVFPDADEIRPDSRVLTVEKASEVKNRLGGKWTLYPHQPEFGERTEHDSVTFFFATRQGRRTGAARVESEPGKWGPTQYVIALDTAGRVTDVAVMSYVGQHGRPIATKRFLGQFIGKTVENPIEIGKDIDAVSGATMISRATAFAVKKVLALYATVYAADVKSGK